MSSFHGKGYIFILPKKDVQKRAERVVPNVLTGEPGYVIILGAVFAPSLSQNRDPRPSPLVSGKAEYGAITHLPHNTVSSW